MRRVDRLRCSPAILTLVCAPLVAGCMGESQPAERQPAPAGPPAAPPPERPARQSTFTTVEPAPPAAAPSPSGPPARAVGVDEGDVYAMAGARLFYLSTYRGFLVYDLTDPQHPASLARLPIHGYPVEMFVDGDTVHALVRDALYLTEEAGTMRFESHHVSQLHTIDVSDPSHPRLLATLDIEGRLAPGSSRKVGNAIYVASVKRAPQYEVALPTQAWVYAFDLSDPRSPRQVGRLPLLEPRPADPDRGFVDVTITATADALLVAENYMGRYVSGGDLPDWLHSFPSRAVVSIIDVSDPGGSIARRARFEVTGKIADPFKMSHRVDPATGRSIFYALLQNEGADNAPRTWRHSQLEAWDVTDGTAPARLGALSVDGHNGDDGSASVFDIERGVFYLIASTLTAFDLRDPRALTAQSLAADEGLGGTAVLRPVGEGGFLLATGLEYNDACGPAAVGGALKRVVISLIDVRDLGRMRMVQRRCDAAQDATGVGALVDPNELHQVHKLLGGLTDGPLDLLTVPLAYSVREDNLPAWWPNWWWERWQSAVGLFSWDLSAVDAPGATQREPIVSHGIVGHPEGSVHRTVLFRHPVSGRRTMVNLSDSHLAVTDLEDLDHPRLQSVVEVAPTVYEIQKLGDYIIERIDVGPGRWSVRGGAEFRIKRAGGPLEDRPTLATFQVPQATEAYRYKDLFVVMRNAASVDNLNAPPEALIYDLADPTQPRLASRVTVPFPSWTYYGHFCGNDWGTWLGQTRNTLITDVGLVRMYPAVTDEPNRRWVTRVAVLDLRDPDAPSIIEATAPAGGRGLAADLASPAGFYLIHSETLEPTRFRYLAQRWDLVGGALVPGADVNVPGRLFATWRDAAGRRLMLSTDREYDPAGRARASDRLHLLEQVADHAELIETLQLPDRSLLSLVFDGERLFANVMQYGDWDRYNVTGLPWEMISDRLMILTVGTGRLKVMFDEPIPSMDTELMGVEGNHLFLKLGWDGMLVTDVSDLAHPRGTRFLPTRGWATHVAVAGSEAYVAAGSFGVFHFDLNKPAFAPGTESPP
jgi:hypothetical protein